MFAYHGYESLIDPHLYKADHCCFSLLRVMTSYSSVFSSLGSQLKNTRIVFLDLELTYISICFGGLIMHPALKNVDRPSSMTLAVCKKICNKAFIA